MMPLLVITLISVVLLTAMVIVSTYAIEKKIEESEEKMEQFVGESLCELMNAVFNAEEVKTRAKKAVEEGREYIEL